LHGSFDRMTVAFRQEPFVAAKRPAASTNGQAADI